MQPKAVLDFIIYFSVIAPAPILTHFMNYLAHILTVIEKPICSRIGGTIQ